MTTIKRHEILFIDTNVSDAQSLIAGISPDVEVVLLNDKTNVINQIATALDGRKTSMPFISFHTVPKVNWHFQTAHSITPMSVITLLQMI